MQREQCLRCSRHLLNVCCCNSFHPYLPKVRLVLYIQCLWRKLISRNTGAWIHACSWGWAGICHHDVSYQSSRPGMWGVVHFSVSSRFICSHPIGCLWRPVHVAWHVPSLKRVQLISHLSSWPVVRHGCLYTCCSRVWSQGRRGGASDWAPGWVKAVRQSS